MSGRRDSGHATLRHQHSHHNVHPYEPQGKKEPKNNRRRSQANSVFEELHDDARTLQEEAGPRRAVDHAGCNQSCKTPSICNKCNALFQGLSSPIGSYIQGEIFNQAARNMQQRNAVSNAHQSNFPQQSQNPSSSPSKKYPRNISSGDGFCEYCHALGDELRNKRYACGQFPLPALSRTHQATRDSPDYVPFHPQHKEAQESQHSNYNCVQCFSMEGHLQNSLFRDMRNFYGTLQWQRQSKDIDDCYAHKEGVPYAPFAKEPVIDAMANCKRYTGRWVTIRFNIHNFGIWYSRYGHFSVSRFDYQTDRIGFHIDCGFILGGRYIKYASLVLYLTVKK
ncbi:hypothetical protein QZH41_006139 [Actinostola sp. cb2023]|nr:hypothetical protein QZH41_006139 [Actinostola sp. cb2023]